MTIVVKVGSRVLTTPDGQLNLNQMRQLVADIMACQQRVLEPIILVTSGAIVCGSVALKCPVDTLPDKQAAAAVGQGLLMTEYRQFFRDFGVQVAQVLVTHDSFEEPEKRRNVKNTLDALLAKQVVPIINENDTVSTAEINLGDNDQLASLTARLVGASQLVLLSDVDGVYGPNGDVVAQLDSRSVSIDSLVDDANRRVSNGGMRSKLFAAYDAVAAGVSVTIANGTTPNIVAQVIENRGVGTQVI